MDSTIFSVIQKLIDDDRGDTYRLQHILDTLLNRKKLFNSDRKYVIALIEKYSEDPNIAKYLDPNYKESPKNPTVTFADNISDTQKIPAAKYNYPKSSKKGMKTGPKILIVMTVVVVSIFLIGTNGGTFACYVLEMKNPFCNVVGITVFDKNIDINIFRFLDIGDSSDCYGTLTESDKISEPCLEEKRWNLDNMEILLQNLQNPKITIFN